MIWVDDLKNPEGPVLLSDGSWVLVEMHPDRGWVLHLSADGKSRNVITQTGRPNGLTLDKHGMIWVAESVNPPALLRTDLSGNIETLLTGCDGDPLLFPNDLAFGPDGALYMTDSGVLQPEWAPLTPEERSRVHPDGRLYRIDPTDLTIAKLDSGLAFANGIAFGPDDAIYVSTTLDGKIWRYDWSAGEVGKREEFGNLLDPAKEGASRGGDGMAFGQDGNIYAAVVGQGDVTVLDSNGAVINRIQLAGLRPTNVAFGPDGEHKIYVTEQGVGHFEVHDVDTAGQALYYG